MNVGPVAEQLANHALVTALTGDEQWRPAVLPSAGNFIPCTHTKGPPEGESDIAAAAAATAEERKRI